MNLPMWQRHIILEQSHFSSLQELDMLLETLKLRKSGSALEQAAQGNGGVNIVERI